MNLLRVARQIAYSRTAAESGPPSEISVSAVLHDGAGQEVEYEVECSIGPSGFDVSKVVRSDTMQDVDPESFKTVYGKASLEKLWDRAKEMAAEVEKARAEEEIGGEEEKFVGEGEALEAQGESPEKETAEPEQQTSQASTRTAASTDAPSGLTPTEYGLLALDCLDQAGLSRHGQDAVFEVISQEIDLAPESEA